MVIFPLSAAEDRTIRWAVRLIPALAIAVVLFLGAISIAAS